VVIMPNPADRCGSCAWYSPRKLSWLSKLFGITSIEGFCKHPTHSQQASRTNHSTGAVGVWLQNMEVDELDSCEIHEKEEVQ